MKISRVTIVATELEAGVVYEIAEGQEGRYLVPINLSLREAVFAAVQAELDKQVLDLSDVFAARPEAITSALFELRSVKQEVALEVEAKERALGDKTRAESARYVAALERQALEIEIEKQKATLADLKAAELAVDAKEPT